MKAINGMKQCPDCRKEGLGPKPISSFCKSRNTSDGLNVICRAHASRHTAEWQRENREKAKEKYRRFHARHPERRRETHAKWRYKITPQRYDQMLKDQGGVCAICLRPCSTGLRLAVDHDRSCCPGLKSCGQCIRGLLCRDCNTTLGKMLDSVESLARAITYLNKGKSANNNRSRGSVG